MLTEPGFVALRLVYRNEVVATAQNQFEYRDELIRRLGYKRCRDFSSPLRSSEYAFLENSATTNKVRIIEKINFLSGFQYAPNDSSLNLERGERESEQ